ncbi:MAG: hypothetical protein R3B09_05605 [Nannocystaceae bacterium]
MPGFQGDDGEATDRADLGAGPRRVLLRRGREGGERRSTGLLGPCRRGRVGVVDVDDRGAPEPELPPDHDLVAHDLCSERDLSEHNHVARDLHLDAFPRHDFIARDSCSEHNFDARVFCSEHNLDARDSCYEHNFVAHDVHHECLLGHTFVARDFCSEHNFDAHDSCSEHDFDAHDSCSEHDFDARDDQ